MGFKYEELRSAGELKGTTVYLPKGLKRSIRACALDHGLSMSKLVCMAVAEYLIENGADTDWGGLVADTDPGATGTLAQAEAAGERAAVAGGAR